MDYTLHATQRVTHAPARQHRKIVPPKPGKGERKPRPYSQADLNALWATAHSKNWLAMVTLNPPPACRIKTWLALRTRLKELKTTLTNWSRRENFPPLLLVTEFDPDAATGDLCANFHIGLASPLTHAQQQLFAAWWLRRTALPDNRGRAFQHDAEGGGLRLQDYLAKDITRRGGHRRHVKFSPPWLPERTDMRLWFIIGAKRQTASQGARLRAKRSLRRRRFDSEHGKLNAATLTASTGSPDSEHASASITTVPTPLPPASPTVSHTHQATQSTPRQECQICRRRWGMSLWAGSCKCNPAFPNC